MHQPHLRFSSDSPPPLVTSPDDDAYTHGLFPKSDNSLIISIHEHVVDYEAAHLSELQNYLLFR